ncbi:MAG TPA: hypothetical protein VM577_05400 [Anaerovoracaceae bacterium]|nr:hypothetical protein [Anaerovoracaceae bacterium]
MVTEIIIGVGSGVVGLAIGFYAGYRYTATKMLEALLTGLSGGLTGKK